MSTKILDRKSKIFKIVIQIVSVMAFLGYFFSLYKGNERNVSSYSFMILIFTFVNDALYTKEKADSSIINVGARINGVLLVIWFITILLRIFM